MWEEEERKKWGSAEQGRHSYSSNGLTLSLTCCGIQGRSLNLTILQFLSESQLEPNL